MTSSSGACDEIRLSLRFFHANILEFCVPGNWGNDVLTPFIGSVNSAVFTEIIFTVLSKRNLHKTVSAYIDPLWVSTTFFRG